VQDSYSKLYAPLYDGLTFCGTRVYKKVDSTPPLPTSVSLTLLDLGNGNFEVKLSSTAVTDVGTYSVKVEVTLEDYPDAPPATTTVTVEVTKCVVTGIIPIQSVDLSLQSYTIFNDEMTIPFAYEQVPACEYDMTFEETLTSATDAGTYNEDDQTFSLFSLETSHAADAFLVSLKIIITDNDGVEFDLIEDFDIEIIDPCPTASLSGDPMPPHVISFIGAFTIPVNVPVFTDSFSDLLEIPEICGSVMTTFTVTDPEHENLGYKKIGDILYVSTWPPYEEVTIEMHRTTRLANYPAGPELTEKFYLDFFLLESPPIEPIVYNITQGEFEIDYQKSVLTPAIRAQELGVQVERTLTLVDKNGRPINSKLPSWIDFEPATGRILIGAWDVNTAGVYDFVIKTVLSWSDSSRLVN